MNNSVATTKVEYDENGQLSVLFPADFLEKLNLIDGQVLQWFMDDSDTFTVKKVNLVAPSS